MLKEIKRKASAWLEDRELSALLFTLPLLALAVWMMVSFLAPFCVAILLAYLIEVAVQRLARLGMPRLLGISLMLLVAVLLFLLAILLGLPYFFAQLKALAEQLPRTAEALESFVGWANNQLPSEFAIDKTTMLDNINRAAVAVGQSILESTLPNVAGVVSLGVYLVLIPFLIFFMLKDKEAIFNWLARFLPKRKVLAELYESMDEQVGSYIRGKLIEAAVVGFASWIGFLFFGLNYAFVLAVLVGFSVIIPYVGAVAVTIPVLLVAYFQFGFTPDFGYVAAYYFVIQAIDGQIIVPLLFSEVVKIHPVGLFAAILFFGGLWGIWGVFFAIPLASLIKSILVVIEKHTPPPLPPPTPAE